MSPNAGGGAGVAACGVSSYKYGTAVHRSPNKPRRSNFIFKFNHMLTGYRAAAKGGAATGKEAIRTADIGAAAATGWH
jgi:hypothetical protein